jgi:hypothetical protein
MLTAACIVGAIVVLGILANRFGHDSRDGFSHE